MALTPEDVLNKTFTQTQFRRGYDEREVDDFLDDIVAEMRRMTKEADDLRGSSTTAARARAWSRHRRDAGAGRLGSRPRRAEVQERHARGAGRRARGHPQRASTTKV